MLKRIRCKGFKSIREMDLELGRINVLIGANGSGKSNLVQLLRLVQYLVEERLQYFTRMRGGADALLHLGPGVTHSLELELEFETVSRTVYKCELRPTDDGGLVIHQEEGWVSSLDKPYTRANRFEASHRMETSLRESSALTTMEWNAVVYGLLKNTRTYHFSDTSSTSGMRRACYVDDYAYLRGNGENLAPVLYRLKQSFPQHFRIIQDTVQLVAPFFQGFHIEVDPEDAYRNVLLNWRCKDQEYLYRPHQLPDGLLRFIALSTILLLPRQLRCGLVAIDEPELGLHPYAIELLGGLIHKASHDSQIIIATHSLNLLNEFELGDVVVVEIERGGTKFVRPDVETYKHWLEDYALSEIWEKNLIGGGP